MFTLLKNFGACGRKIVPRFLHRNLSNKYIFYFNKLQCGKIDKMLGSWNITKPLLYLICAVYLSKDISCFICSLMARFFCMKGIQQYCTERTRLKISDMFLIKFLFIGLNVSMVTLFRCFSFSFTFCQIIYFEYLTNI